MLRFDYLGYIIRVNIHTSHMRRFDFMKRAHEVDFKVHGDDMQFVEIQLDQNETIIAEAGAMMYMDQNIRMETIFGDGSGSDEGKGLMGKGSRSW